MTAVAAPAESAKKFSKRRFGYIVWSVALGFFFVPEILASWKTVDRHLPFTTFSGMVAHLEYVNSLVEVGTTAIIVFVLVSIIRLPPKRTSGGHTARHPENKPHRTPGGRLTYRLTPEVERTDSSFDDDAVPVWFAVTSVGAALLIAFGTIAARLWWPDAPPKPGETNALFHPGYILYSSIALLWFVAPSLYAFIAGRDAPFPTLSRTLSNLELRLQKRGSVGGACAWFLSYILVWGLVFLMLHLTLYPFPNITRLLNPTGQ